MLKLLASGSPFLGVKCVGRFALVKASMMQFQKFLFIAAVVKHVDQSMLTELEHTEFVNCVKDEVRRLN